MTCTWSTAASAGLVALLSALGCGLIVSSDELGDAIDGVAADIDEYEELAATLEAARTQALDEHATALQTAGPWLAWLDGQTLTVRDHAGGAQGAEGADGVELPITITAGDYRISETHASTATIIDGGVRYQSVALASAQLVDEQTFAKPESADWSPYVLLGDALIVVEEQPGAHTIQRWRVGVDDPVALGTLEQAGVALERVAQLEAIVDDGEALLVVRAAGQLWVVELDALLATSVAELDELLAVAARGLLFTRGEGLYLYEFNGQTTRIDEAIAATGYRLNATFASIHEYAGDGATLSGDRVYYIGSAGLFAYALSGTGPEAITAILIEPRWDVGEAIPRIEYRAPIVSAGGTVFVRGLIGPNGEVGDAGPIYAIPSVD